MNDRRLGVALVKDEAYLHKRDSRDKRLNEINMETFLNRNQN